MHDDQERMLNTAQLAERWDTTVPRLANLRSMGAGPAYFKIGARVLYPLAAIREYEAMSLVQPQGGAA